ncbi:hypothetical protein [Georgenia sp. Z1491]|uniref:hypothetical protein n=1 Tax=Georgenia sp. Z1491 TaxID=3416707 RepID=UPI003CE89A8F
MRTVTRPESRPTVRPAALTACAGAVLLVLTACGTGELARPVSEPLQLAAESASAGAASDGSDGSGATAAAEQPSAPSAPADPDPAPGPEPDPADVPEDAVTLDITWPQAWAEQPAAAESLPPGSLAMATVTESGTIAAATVVLQEDPAGTTDWAAVLVGRGADPASVVEGEARTVSGAPATRWEARSTSGEWDTIAYPVPGPDGLVALFSFVVTADRADEVEDDIASVLDSVELG